MSKNKKNNCNWVMVLLIVVLIISTSFVGINIKRISDKMTIPKVEVKHTEIGVYDKAKIVNSPVIASMFAPLREEDNKLQQEINSKYKALDNEAKKIEEKYKNNKKELEKQRKILSEKYNKLGKESQDKRNKLNTKIKEMSDKIEDLINTAMGNVVKSKNITALYPKSIVFSIEYKDYTDDIIQAIK